MKQVWVSAHDYTSAQITVIGGADVILVGDSLGMTVYGFQSTREVTMEMMLRHTEAVLKAVPNGFPVVADMPYKSYETPKIALKNAERFRKIGVSRIKLEGGSEVFPQIDILISAGFEVTGHLGLLPQTAEKFSVAGKESASAQKIFRDAENMQKGGVRNIILECVPASLAQKITEFLKIPVIGIGAGKETDGQILVYNDLVGKTEEGFHPKFLRRFGNSRAEEVFAIQKFATSVRSGEFPNSKEWY